MQEEERLLKMLSHYRHDMMNEVQLLKAYLSMNRTEKASAVVDRMVVEAEQHSRLHRLGAPRFACSLLEWMWEAPPLPVELDIHNGDGFTDVETEALTLFASFRNWLDSYVPAGAEGSVQITVKPPGRMIFEAEGGGWIYKKLPPELEACAERGNKELWMDIDLQ
ncbi:Spo0B domain-containing protein [Alkalicoccus urumqiensis]|uniref:SpoOB alpha-helical domain-containing protein n=1 Tax=Alkalicoccus urumqiensis TaxID=1548213 RepID=A0A2P6MFF8_ALKUR|nr:Spo0B domain-containing protein [Alkalicoccus urumqiensis]PRO64997.1 hypothetical protein C6I21_11130 [Alkalicoccus urumqiensis]